MVSERMFQNFASKYENLYRQHSKRSKTFDLEETDAFCQRRVPSCSDSTSRAIRQIPQSKNHTCFISNEYLIFIQFNTHKSTSMRNSVDINVIYIFTILAQAYRKYTRSLCSYAGD
ncbi:unnamed protein product [Albugo candida]|uniref:Uncharacterized protein n=1 Tax=Albugo candida TaxID=65357 RepID=A0A024G2Y2_9STRA|nr:unnamed protein product [Albugo candida]|eukprot:CCI41218.1 unnamed protein product [Albugo candida]